MAIKLEVAKADLSFEAAFAQPEFSLFQNTPVLLHHLFKRLEPHGLRLSDLRVERGGGSIADHHVLCYLFGYWMTVRVRVEKIEVVCSDLPEQRVEKFKAAIQDVLKAVKDCRPELSFRAFALAVGMHVKLSEQPVREYLAQFVSNTPAGLGASTGSGTVFYFGPEGDRLLSSITVDMSAVIPDATYLRLHAVWDAKKVAVDSLPAAADGFVRCAVEALGLQLPG